MELEEGFGMNQPVKTILCDDLATLVLNRPKVFNAFNFETISGAVDHIINIATDDTIRALVVTGEGPAFCAGADLRAVSDWPEGAAAGFHNMAARYHQLILEIRRMHKPVIAAVNGMAAGGGFSLALACDFRVMEESAVLRQAYTSNGLSVDGGGTFTLPRLVGLARALEIVAFDKPISATQALEWGLVTRVVPDGKAMEESLAMAEDLKKVSLKAFSSAKQLMTDAFSNGFESHLELERAHLKASAAHPDGIEGIEAFLEKRKPVFI
jgi:2-(1,2-epoxy-1,2-dihydrophenyl)acetyl-CoA isomerase